MAGNASRPSPVLVVRTLPPDREPPTTPASLRSPAQAETSVELAWDAASDDVGVMGYRLYGPSGSIDLAGTSRTHNGLAPDTAYAFQVSALDAAGHESSPSQPLLVRTLRPDRQPPTTPQNLRSTVRTETSIELAWDAASDDVGVTVYRLFRPSGPIDLVGTSHSETGLDPDAVYEYRVSALDAAGHESAPSPSLLVRTLRPDRQRPTTPPGLRSPARTETSIALAWDAASDDVGVLGYRLYGPSGVVDLVGTSHSESGLDPDVEYAFQVSAFDASGKESMPSPVLRVRTLRPDRELPTTPPGLRSPGRTETSIDLAWDAASDDVGVVGYRLYGPGGAFDLAGTSHGFEGLDPDTAYAFQVAALDAVGNESVPSQVLVVRTLRPDLEPPTTPERLFTLARTETRIDLAWTASTDDVGVTTYRLYGPGGVVDVAGTGYAVFALAPDTAYAFQVSALDAVGNESLPSELLMVRTLAPDVEPPTTPQNLRSPARTDSSIDLAWDASTDDRGVTGYRVYGPGGPVDVEGTAYSETGLAPGTDYDFQVSAFDAAGNESARSPVLTVTTLGPRPFPLSIRVAAGNDDVEENVATGSVSRTSSDLELAVDGTRVQAVGLRFLDVRIPQGAPIVSASVQFTADEARGGAASLVIHGEASDQAEPFTSSSGDVTRRPTTTAAVAWTPPDWNTVGAAGPAERTPDLAAVLQEIVDRPGWARGNALVLVVTGTGTRTAESYDGVAAAAPRLDVVYLADPDLEPPSTPGNLRSPARTETSIDLAWDAATDNLEVTAYRLYGPSGAVDVTDTFHTETGLTPDTEYVFQVSALDAAGNESPRSPPLAVRTVAPDITPPSTPANLRSPAQTASTIELAWDAATDDRGVVGYRVYGPSGPVDVAGTAYTETGLAPITAYDFQVSAFDAAGNESVLTPVLGVSTNGFEAVTVSVQVASGDDDAEENVGSGSVSLTSSDLELVVAGSTVQAVGVRFAGLAIPQGADIVSASVQFTVDEVTGGAVALTIRGEAADSAAPFTTATGDVSGRPTTSAALAWSPPDWTSVGAAGPEQRTPDLTPLVQEIVDRPGWNPGNALVLVVTGTGRRTAESFNGVAASAPRLDVVHLVDVVPPDTPANLRSPAQTDVSIDLAWDPATDNAGVAGYRVYGPSGPVDVAGTTYTESGLAPGTAYAFQVSALDAAGNESALSPMLTVSTTGAPAAALPVAAGPWQVANR
jgi:chitodextrinase